MFHWLTHSTDTYARLLSALFISCCLSGLGCGDDSSTTNNDTSANNTSFVSNNGTQCGAGQFYNDILGRCIDQPPPTPTTPPVNNNSSTSSQNNSSGTGTTTSTGGHNTTNNTTNNATTGGTGTSTTTTTTAPPIACGYGSLIGRACAPSGESLASALVKIEGIDCHTNMVFSQTVSTEGDGSYAFTNIPSGIHSITIEAGSFSRSLSARINADEETDLKRQAEKYCLDATAVSLAVIEGSYDDVGGILDELQLTYEVKGNDGAANLATGQITDQAGLNRSIAFLKDLTAMSQFDIIFINCGNLWDILNNNFASDVATIVNNLKSYYQQGGSIYASDWAWMFIEQPIPNVIDFFPIGIGNDTDDRAARQGYAPQDVMASVESSSLQALLGKLTVPIDFANDPAAGIFGTNWVIAATADPQAVVHLRGTATQCRSTGLSPCGSAGATLPNVPLMITYKNPVSGGSVAFTSFHNHPEGVAVSPDISKILKFLIFQL